MTPAFRRVGTSGNRRVARARGELLGVRRYRASDGFDAYVPEVVLDRLVAFARMSAPNEWAGLLAVRRHEDDMGQYVVVIGVVQFPHAEATATSVATTVEGERRAREVFEAAYADAELGGWCHSHPPGAFFFSGTDRITQRTWTSPTSLGVVVLPTRPERLLVVRGPDAEEMRRIEEHDPPPPRRAPAPARIPRPRARRVALVACGAFVLCAVSWGARLVLVRERARMAELERRVGTVEERVARLKPESDPDASAP